MSFLIQHVQNFVDSVIPQQQHATSSSTAAAGAVENQSLLKKNTANGSKMTTYSTIQNVDETATSASSNGSPRKDNKTPPERRNTGGSSGSDNDDKNSHHQNLDDSQRSNISVEAVQQQHDDDHDDDCDNMSVSTELTQLVLVAAATAATLGYDVGIMAAAIQPLETEMELNSIQKEVAMGSLNFVAAAGALLGGSIANKEGRLPTVKVCAWLFVVGTICMAFAPIYSILLLGRIITGMGVGVSFVVAPVYLSEVAPPHMRGQLNTVFDVAINGGILLGYVIGFIVQLIPFIPDNIEWRIMLGMGLILPVVVLYNLAKLPESPRWLVMADQSAAASQVLQGLGQNPRQVVRTISSIEDELHSEMGEVVSIWRWSPGMKLVIALGFWQQITGTEAVLYYSSDFLAHAGLTSATQRLLGNCFVGLCKLTPELIAMRLVDRIGRRPLILGSAISLCITTGLLAMSFFLAWSPLTVIILLCAVMASFSIGLGPFTFLVASENLGLSERATGMTLCAASNRVTSGAVAMTAVTLYESLGSGGLFSLYAIVGLFSIPFYYATLKETTGQTLEELAAARSQSRGATPKIPRPMPSLREHEEHTAVLNGEMA